MTDFDEKSGTVPCKTPWGQWWQTMEEVYIEVNVPPGTRGKDIACDFCPRKIKVSFKGQTIIEGSLPGIVHADDSLWTLEDQNFLRICLIKTDKRAANCWRSLLVGQYESDPKTYDEMEQKMTLQRYQLENPGFDFSGADISGNYHGGGPDLPS